MPNTRWDSDNSTFQSFRYDSSEDCFLPAPEFDALPAELAGMVYVYVKYVSLYMYMSVCTDNTLWGFWVPFCKTAS